MKYRIVDATVKIKGKNIPKKNIEYIEKGVVVLVECYELGGEVITQIKPEYTEE